MLRRWLWLKWSTTRALLRRRKRPCIEPLEDRFLLNAATPAINVQSLYQSLPLSFEANQGQFAPPVQYSSSGPGYTVFLTSASAYLSLQKDQTTGTAPPALVQMQLLNANSNARGIGLNQQDYTSNYLIGNDPGQWHEDIANFGRVKFSDVYKGIDLIYYGNARQLEYDFVVAPGANPNAIALAFPGSPILSLDATGDLVVHTTGGDLIEHAPVLYQMQGTQKVPIQGNYVLGPSNTVHFQVGAYDPSLPLVIDPVLSYATYLGGSGADNGQSVAVDAAGNVYVTGFTGSTNFPTTPGTLQNQLGGQGNVFVAKINPAGTGLVYSTFVGGGAFDLGLAIRVDIAGNAYVVGTTTSGNFPIKNAIQGTFGGGSDGLPLQVNPSGNQLVFSTYLGGSGSNSPRVLLWMLPATSTWLDSPTRHFPTVNALQSTSNGGQEVWVAKIASSGTSLIYSTYLGGSLDDSAQAIGIDSSGNAYVVGDTYSPNFPVKNSLQAYAGGDEAFVTKLNASGSAILFSTYLGGSGDDRASSIRLDAAGNIYVVGSTSSANFPTVNALQPTFGGITDVFITKLNSTGSAITFSTYLGGSDIDQAMSLAIDSSSSIYVVGFTASSNFPTVNPDQAALGGGDGDAFIAKLSGNGSSLIYSTYFGGNDDDAPWALPSRPPGIFMSQAQPPLAIYRHGTPTIGFGGDDGFVVKLSQAPLNSACRPGQHSRKLQHHRIGPRFPGNPAGDYTGTIHFTSSDPGCASGRIPDGAFTPLRGFGSSPWARKITATDIANNSIVGSHWHRRGAVSSFSFCTFHNDGRRGQHHD